MLDRIPVEPDFLIETKGEYVFRFSRIFKTGVIVVEHRMIDEESSKVHGTTVWNSVYKYLTEGYLREVGLDNTLRLLVDEIKLKNNFGSSE